MNRTADDAESAARQHLGPSAPPPRTLLAWLLFIPYLLLFFTCLLIFEAAIRLSLLFGPAAQSNVRDWFQSTMLWTLRLLGTRWSVEGDPAVVSGVPYIIVSNHQSIFDIPFLYCTFMPAHPRYIAKKELSRWIPGVSINLRVDGSAIIDRSNPRHAIPEIKRAAKQAAEEGFAIVIFPEGTRAKEGVMKSFRPSGLSTLMKYMPEAEIIPVAIDESWKLFCHRRGPVPTGIHLRMMVGRAMKRQDESAEEFVALVEQQVRGLLSDLRTAAAPLSK